MTRMCHCFIEIWYLSRVKKSRSRLPDDVNKIYYRLEMKLLNCNQNIERVTKKTIPSGHATNNIQIHNIKTNHQETMLLKVKQVGKSNYWLVFRKKETVVKLLKRKQKNISTEIYHNNLFNLFWKQTSFLEASS